MEPAVRRARRDAAGSDRQRVRLRRRRPDRVPAGRPHRERSVVPVGRISSKGDVNVNFYDRRLDIESPAGVGEWPTSKTRQGNYLLWRFGGICSDHDDRHRDDGLDEHPCFGPAVYRADRANHPSPHGAHQSR